MIPERVYVRVMENTVRDETGCLVSGYSTGSHGYAQVGWREEGESIVSLCHLVVWRWVNGPIPDGMTVDHECRNRKCVEVSHLRLLPNLENARRTNGWDWPMGTCRHGHGPEFWRPKSEVRLKGYCSECRRQRRLRIVAP